MIGYQIVKLLKVVEDFDVLVCQKSACQCHTSVNALSQKDAFHGTIKLCIPLVINRFDISKFVGE